MLASEPVPAREPSGPELQLLRLRCVDCGYGASCRLTPARCPMCGGRAWQYDETEVELMSELL